MQNPKNKNQADATNFLNVFKFSDFKIRYENAENSMTV